MKPVKMLETTQPDDLLSLEQAAAFAGGGLTVKVIKAAIEAGHLAYYEIASKKSVTLADIAEWRSASRDLPSTTDSRGVVYFIQEGESGPIKIGKAGDPAYRLASLQTGNPRELRLLGIIPGGHDREFYIHRMLFEHRIRGEWFEPSPIVLAVVQKALAEHSIPRDIPGIVGGAS